MSIISKLIQYKQRVSQSYSGNIDRFKFLDIGFHGDQYLIEIVDFLAQYCEFFIETGTNVGSTLTYFAGKYPQISCISCEPDEKAFQLARQNTSKLNNVSIFNELSQNFLFRLEREYQHLFNKECLFWLDAHGYGFKWPLKEELNFITTKFGRGYVLIDDFKVPGLEDVFKYDIYQEQICSFDYVKDSLSTEKKYNVYYPNYTDKTSKHHPLVGWGLIEFGHSDELVIPENLQNKVNISRSGDIIRSM